MDIKIKWDDEESKSRILEALYGDAETPSFDHVVPSPIDMVFFRDQPEELRKLIKVMCRSEEATSSFRKDVEDTLDNPEDFDLMIDRVRKYLETGCYQLIMYKHAWKEEWCKSEWGTEHDISELRKTEEYFIGTCGQHFPEEWIMRLLKSTESSCTIFGYGGKWDAWMLTVEHGIVVERFDPSVSLRHVDLLAMDSMVEKEFLE